MIRFHLQLDSLSFCDSVLALVENEAMDSKHLDSSSLSSAYFLRIYLLAAKWSYFQTLFAFIPLVISTRLRHFDWAWALNKRFVSRWHASLRGFFSLFFDQGCHPRHLDLAGRHLRSSGLDSVLTWTVKLPCSLWPVVGRFPFFFYQVYQMGTIARQSKLEWALNWNNQMLSFCLWCRVWALLVCAFGPRGCWGY